MSQHAVPHAHLPIDLTLLNWYDLEDTEGLSVGDHLYDPTDEVWGVVEQIKGDKQLIKWTDQRRGHTTRNWYQDDDLAFLGMYWADLAQQD